MGTIACQLGYYTHTHSFPLNHVKAELLMLYKKEVGLAIKKKVKVFLKCSFYYWTKGYPCLLTRLG